MGLNNAGRRLGRQLFAAGLLCVLGLAAAHAQTLRFSNHREVKIPKYAVLRIGPFYSSARLSLTTGYMYTDTDGSGTAYIFRNRRGDIREDGSEFPVISTLQLRNYLLVTRRMDVDMSARVSYEYYPLDTRESGFYVDLVDEGVLGNISTEIIFTPYLKGTLYDWFIYRADYIDTRGLEDRYGGRRYEFIRNGVGFDLDWKLARDKNVGVSLTRFDEWPQSDTFDERERTSYKERLIYEQEMVRNFVLGAEVSFEQIDYESDERNDGEIQRYFLFSRYRGGDTDGIAMRLTEASTLTVGVGYAVAYSLRRGERSSGDVTEEDDFSRDRNAFTGFVTLETGLRKDLQHMIKAERDIYGGFTTAFELVDSLEYRILWEGEVSAASFFTRYSDVEPAADFTPGYSDWATGAELRYPLMPYVDLNLLTRYTIRDNDVSDEPVDILDETEVFDYDTWVTRAGTSFRVSKEVTFDFYYQHTERYSDSPDLEYSRDLVAALFTYSHEF